MLNKTSLVIGTGNRKPPDRNDALAVFRRVDGVCAGFDLLVLRQHLRIIALDQGGGFRRE
jgi:hypothetical protein